MSVDRLVQQVADALMEKFHTRPAHPEYDAEPVIDPPPHITDVARTVIEALGLTEERGEFDTTVVRYKTDWMPRADS